MVQVLKFSPTGLDGSYLIDIEKKQDDRGFFARYFCEKEFANEGLNCGWSQINNSMSDSKGTLRGMHFQRSPHSEVKLIRCIKGVVWDVIVDLRKDSLTYGKWFGANLSEDNRTMMYVPKGFAHGFITLTPSSEVIYLVSDAYVPNAEGSLLWSDPTVGIKWPIQPVTMSEKDADAPQLSGLNL